MSAMASPYNLTATEAEFERFEAKSFEALKAAIYLHETKCEFLLEWINSEVAKAGQDPWLSFFVFSPEFSHAVRLRIDRALKTLYEKVRREFPGQILTHWCCLGTVNGTQASWQYLEDQEQKQEQKAKHDQDDLD